MPSAIDLAGALRDLEQSSDTIPTSILLGAGYDGEKRLAFLEFYDPVSQRIFHYYDKSGHLPYCFTKEPLEELSFLKQRKDVVDVRAEEKMDLINDKRVLVSRIVTSDPLAIGGATNERSIRNVISGVRGRHQVLRELPLRQPASGGLLLLGQGWQGHPRGDGDRRGRRGRSFTRAWRARLRPSQTTSATGHCCYPAAAGHKARRHRYRGLFPGREPHPRPREGRVPGHQRLPGWERRQEGRLRAREARTGAGPRPGPPDVEKRFFKTEPELLLSIYDDLIEYPIVITFNGDDFDLPYLYQRSLNMNIPKDSIPITRGNADGFGPPRHPHRPLQGVQQPEHPGICLLQQVQRAHPQRRRDRTPGQGEGGDRRPHRGAPPERTGLLQLHRLRPDPGADQVQQRRVHEARS